MPAGAGHRRVVPMLELQREPVPLNDDNEMDTALAFLSFSRSVNEEPRTLRWVLAHMTGETTRHAGHADILRELIDGVTGR